MGRAEWRVADAAAGRVGVNDAGVQKGVGGCAVSEAQVARGREGWPRYQVAIPACLPTSRHANERKMRTTLGHVQKEGG
jgi:hypothetical protein